MEPRSRRLAGPIALAVALALTAGCADVPGGEPGVARSAQIPPDFEPVVDLCPETDDWGEWGQTSLDTWDWDIQPIIQWIIDETGIACTTYDGHHPSIGRAADWRPHSREEGTRLADWLQDNITGGAAPMGIYYVMWQAQIGYSDEIDWVEDRGSFTQNHCDHVHLAFNDAVDFRPGDVTPWEGAVEPDAGPEPDAGEPDAGEPDAGEPDAAPEPDTGPEPDVGPGPDSGPAPDADAQDDGSTDPWPVDADDAQPRPHSHGSTLVPGIIGGCACAASPGAARFRTAGPLLRLLGRAPR